MAVAKFSCHHPPILGCDLAPGVATISSSHQHSVAGRTSVLRLLCSLILIVVIMRLTKRQRDPTRLQFSIPCPARFHLSLPLIVERPSHVVGLSRFPNYQLGVFFFSSDVARTQGRGRLTEVVCLLKPVTRDRVYLLIVGRVDLRSRPVVFCSMIKVSDDRLGNSDCY
ncbi:hypothetical protein NL676_012288 [Syzygium grande]|nr:hypothetical protein NL676_012288 [Syzygium grande]